MNGNITTEMSLGTIDTMNGDILLMTGTVNEDRAGGTSGGTINTMNGTVTTMSGGTIYDLASGWLYS